MKYLLLIFLCLPCLAQPNYVGVGVTTTFSDGKDGNGQSVGGNVEAVHKLNWGIPIKLFATASLTRDLKGYRNQYGLAKRVRAEARYNIAKSPIFVEAGLYHGRISFPDTATNVNDGYRKSNTSLMLGGGIELNHNDRLYIILNYLYFPKTNLHATDGKGNNPIIDGTSQTHWIGTSTLYNFKGKWISIFTLNWNQNTYIRNPKYYGKLGDIPHRSGNFELTLGIGRKY